MNKLLREHAEKICEYAIKENLPNEAVIRAINEQIEKNAPNFVNKIGKTVLISIGKAAWEMARSAYELLGDKIDCGAVITKYGHIPKEMRNAKCGINTSSTADAVPLLHKARRKGVPLEKATENAKCKMQNRESLVGYLDNIELHEAGHPVVDFCSICATKRALEITKDLKENDLVLFLVSGGGSALFENVDCSLEKMQELTDKLLKSGADIGEMNAIRKHISNVKGGRFANHVYPAKVFSVVLSDVVGNDLSTIASGPACADTTTVDGCIEILKKYKIAVDSEIEALIQRETPKKIENATHVVSGSVSELCQSAMKISKELGYEPTVVNDSVTCNSEEMLALFHKEIEKSRGTKESRAIIFGGEITVTVTGNGLGGRNQHLALSCAEILKGKDNMAVFCVGSDGTDGPTDASGGYADGSTYENMVKKGISPEECLKNSDSYHGLKSVDGLIFTGPTGTNVNDLYVLLIRA